MSPQRRRCAALVAVVGLLVTAYLPVTDHSIKPLPESCNDLMAQGLPGVGAKTAAVASQAIRAGNLDQLPTRAQPYAADWFAWSINAGQSAQVVRGHGYDRGNEHRIDGFDRSSTRSRGDQP